MILTEKELQECVDVITHWTRLILTTEQMSEVLSSDEELQESIQFFGASDTVERETLADLIVCHMGFDHWPINAEMGSEYTLHFWNNVWKKAIEYNYGIEGWSVEA